MNYMLFSKEGEKFPFKLSSKITRKELHKIGFEDIGVVQMEKQEDGTYLHQIDSTQKESLDKHFNEALGHSFDMDRDIEETQKHNPGSVTMINKLELSEKDKQFKEHVDRILQAISNGEEYDHEDYYEILDRNPQLREIQ